MTRPAPRLQLDTSWPRSATEPGVVLRQVTVDGKVNEIALFAHCATTSVTYRLHSDPGYAALSDHPRRRPRHQARRSLPGHSAREPACTLYAAASPALADIPTGHVSANQGHRRAKKRNYKVVTLAAGIAFPMRPKQSRSPAHSLVRRRTEVVYTVTSVTSEPVTPADLVAWIRSHCQIENRLH